MIDDSRHTVAGQRLTRTEWKLFQYLWEHPNQCLPYDRIYNYMWHDPRCNVVFLLRNYLYRLRKKIPFFIVVTHNQLGLELIRNPNE